MIRLRFRKGRGGWIDATARDEAETARMTDGLLSLGFEVERS